MSDESDMVFDAGRAEFWEQYEIFTDDDGKRYVNVGSYIYCAGNDVNEEEDGIVRDWRHVSEYITIPMEKMLKLIEEKDTIWNQPESDFRPSDEIEDLSIDEARERFAEMYDGCPRLHMEDIKENTPDGVYFGVTI